MSANGPVWPQLMTAALLGTARRPARVAAAPSLGDLVTAERAMDGDTGLLETAGVLTVARRAGVAPATGIAAPDPAPEETRPQVGQAAAARLGSLLGGSADMSLVRLWLTLAAGRDLRVPARHLPGLFALVRQDESLRKLAVTVAGARGAWLAAQRPEWGWVVDAVAAAEPPDDPRVWDEGSAAERVAYLAGVRRRDPDTARTLLAEVWSTERPEERATMLGTFAAGLGPDDEAFIEAALDDRRKEVRTVAADLLAKLPGSAYQQRMTKRALACVRAARPGYLAVSPPTDCDAAMKRDGIDLKPPQGIGPRGWWLEQIAMRAPASAWQSLGTPAEVAAAKANDGWAPTLRRGWARAAVTARDPVWATALVEAGYANDANADVTDTMLATSLYELLPPDAAEALALRLLASTRRTTTFEINQSLSGCTRPWSPRLTEALLGYLRGYAVAASSVYSLNPFTEVRDTIAEGIDVRMLVEVRAIADSVREQRDDRYATDLLDKLADIVSVRHQMHQEFS